MENLIISWGARRKYLEHKSDLFLSSGTYSNEESDCFHLLLFLNVQWAETLKSTELLSIGIQFCSC